MYLSKNVIKYKILNLVPPIYGNRALQLPLNTNVFNILIGFKRRLNRPISGYDTCDMKGRY